MCRILLGNWNGQARVGETGDGATPRSVKRGSYGGTGNRGPSDRDCCSAAACRRPLEPASDANLNAARPKLLANAPYAKASIPMAYQRHHRAVSPQGSAGLDRGRYRCALPLLRAAGQQGDPLRRDRRRGSAVLVRHRQGRPQGRVADLDADRRHQEAARHVPELRRRRRAQSDGRARHLSLPGQQGHAVPHPRHQPAGIYRAGDLVGLHPA